MNLDELNSLFATAWSSDDKAQMFEGLVRGSNGMEAPASAPAPLKEANALGLKWRAEAEDFMRKAEEGGKKSAAARASRFGTSQPPSGNSRTPFEDSSNQATSHKLQAVNEQQQAEQRPAAPSPSAPESEKELKARSIAGMEREVSLKEKLLEVWNASCIRAKARGGRALPSCLKFPVDAGPSLKRYMKAYSDDEILQLVTDGSSRVQRNNFWHERKYSLTNLMRNLEANASLPAQPPDRVENDELAQSGRGMNFADDDWMNQ